MGTFNIFEKNLEGAEIPLFRSALRLKKIADDEYKKSLAPNENDKWISSIPFVGWIWSKFRANKISKQIASLERNLNSYEQQIEQGTGNISHFADTTKRLLTTTKIFIHSSNLLGQKTGKELSDKLNTITTKANEIFVSTAKQYFAVNDPENSGNRSFNAKLVERLEEVTEQLLEQANSLQGVKNATRDAAYIRERLGGVILNRVKSKESNEINSFGGRKLDKKQQQNFTWSTVRQKVTKVISILTGADASNGIASLQQRYNYYQQQLDKNAKPKLPAFYHATTLNGLTGIVEDRLIKPSNRADRPGIWVSTVPEVSNNNAQIHAEAKTAQATPLVCGVAFTDNIQWNEITNFGQIKMANFLFNPHNQSSNPDRLWLAFKKLPVLDKDESDCYCLHPCVAFLFFQDEQTYEKFKQASEGTLSKQFFTELEAKHQIVIGTEELVKERDLLQASTLIPSDLQPHYWKMNVPGKRA